MQSYLFCVAGAEISRHPMINFDVAKIEQMEVEFETCPHCKGEGIKDNGIIRFTCPVCHGTGEVEKARNE